MRKIADESFRGNQNTSGVHFFFKSCRLWDNVEKYCTAGQATDGNMAHAHCMPIPKATDMHSEYVIITDFPL
jgi:hypothetical protein